MCFFIGGEWFELKVEETYLDRAYFYTRGEEDDEIWCYNRVIIVIILFFYLFFIKLSIIFSTTSVSATSNSR